MAPAKNFCSSQRTFRLRIRRARVIFSVASQCARATEISCAHVHWSRRQTRRWRDVVAIKINQVLRAGYSVGIVTRCTRGFLVHDVKAMSAALPLAIDRTEALIAEDAVPAVTFVTKGIVRRTFRSVICEN